MHICNGACRGVDVHIGLITEAITFSNPGVTHPTAKLLLKPVSKKAPEGALALTS